MKLSIPLVCAMALGLGASAHSQEITTEEQAEQFLKQYCVALVNEISKAVNLQTKHAAKKDWDKFMEQGDWIAGVADVYGNLCKD